MRDARAGSALDQRRGAPGDEQRQHRIAAARERDAQRLERAGLLVVALHAQRKRLEQIVERLVARIGGVCRRGAGRSCRLRAPGRRGAIGRRSGRCRRSPARRAAAAGSPRSRCARSCSPSAAGSCDRDRQRRRPTPRGSAARPARGGRSGTRARRRRRSGRPARRRRWRRSAPTGCRRTASPASRGACRRCPCGTATTTR